MAKKMMGAFTADKPPGFDYNDKYQHEQDARALMTAAEIKGDKKRHGNAKKWAQKKMSAMKQVVDGDTDGE